MQRKCLIESAKRAGFVDIILLHEPVAASLVAPLDRVAANYIVFDLGAGTLDVTLVEIGGETMQTRHVVGHAGLGDMGGLDFNEAILSRVLQEWGLVADTVESASLSVLRRLCETAKIELSSQPQHIIHWECNDRTYEYTLSRNCCEEWNETNFLRACNLISFVLHISSFKISKSGLSFEYGKASFTKPKKNFGSPCTR